MIKLQRYIAIKVAASDMPCTHPVQDNEKLQREVDELNSTVFSKSFKAPSAWAEREVKYKMEKKAWDEQV